MSFGSEVPAVYICAQIAGAFAGVAVAHLMFGFAIVLCFKHARSGSAQIFSEFVATFGLLAVICGCGRFNLQWLPFAVAAVHCRGILVHGFDVVCESCGHTGAICNGYICGYPASRCTCVHRGPNRRRRSRNGIISLAEFAVEGEEST